MEYTDERGTAYIKKLKDLAKLPPSVFENHKWDENHECLHGKFGVYDRMWPVLWYKPLGVISIYMNKYGYAVDSSFNPIHPLSDFFGVYQT